MIIINIFLISILRSSLTRCCEIMLLKTLHVRITILWFSHYTTYKCSLFIGEYICELETYGDPIHQVNKLHVLGKISYCRKIIIMARMIRWQYKQSQNSSLSVSVPPVISMLNPGRNITVRKGSTVKLVCNATGFPRPEIVWERQVNDIIVLLESFILY